jgi:hypothetical protein
LSSVWKEIPAMKFDRYQPATALKYKKN